MPENYYIGIDVGTGSVRAGLVKQDGTLLASSTESTITWRDPNDHRIFEQSTNNIWDGMCKTIRAVLAEAKVPPSDVKGLGFDATCSLAVSDMNGDPVVVTKGPQLGDIGDRNIILWADHRAEEEANLINSTGSVVLDYVGGTMSCYAYDGPIRWDRSTNLQVHGHSELTFPLTDFHPDLLTAGRKGANNLRLQNLEYLEMEIPKTLWLKKYMAPEKFARCQFFDLPDFLTYKATADNMRSCCSLTCKCSFVPTKQGWQNEFFEKIGLGEFVSNRFKQLGGHQCDVLTAGMPVGRGLTRKAAGELGLVEGTPVGSGVIDAYAGWLGTVAGRYKENDKLSGIPSIDESRHRLAACAGTSTCHIVQSKDGVFVNGVWGPYKDAVMPGWWMNEGGQSSTGQLIDFMIKTHSAYPKLQELAKEQKTNIHEVLQQQLNELCKEEGAATWTELTKDMHFYPDLHGNRSPIADPRMRGSITGLALDDGLSDLARKFNLTLEAIALQTRHIVDDMNASGHAITAIYMSGGQAKNAMMMQLFADTCSMPVVLPKSGGDAVVLGSAMLGRFAHEARGLGKMAETQQAQALWDIMIEMTPMATIVSPKADAKEKKLLEAKYRIFRESIDIQKRWRKEMEEASQ